jgi:hypothetical protein
MKAEDLFIEYRKIINPPYKNKDLLIIIATLFILAAVPLTAFAVKQSRQTSSKAAGNATMALSPVSQSIDQGDNFTVQIQENSNTDPVNAVQANLSFDPAKLEALSIDTTGSAFEIEAENVIGAGTIEIARGTTIPKTGTQLVAAINFRSKLSPGATTVSFAAGTVLVRSTDNTDILGNTTNGVYTIVNPAPTVSITDPVDNQVVSGNVNIAATASDDQGVTKVEFRVDGVLKSSDTTAPYTYNWSTSAGDTGTHTISAKAVDTQNGETTDSISVYVDNQAPSAPSNLSATPFSGSRIDLTWNASTDNIGVVDYDVYRDGAKISTVTETSYNDTGLSPGTSYSYYVKASDGQGNVSAPSNTVNASTIKTGDLNKDGTVNIFDLSILLSNWDSSDPTADLNNDGIVNIFDLSILLSNWDF